MTSAPRPAALLPRWTRIYVLRLLCPGGQQTRHELYVFAMAAERRRDALRADGFSAEIFTTTTDWELTP